VNRLEFYYRRDYTESSTDTRPWSGGELYAALL
jgi:hypothetical protein